MNHKFCQDYVFRMNRILENFDWQPVEILGNALLDAWKEERQVFICGNGGSAGNAIHLANDLLYGISKSDGKGLKVNALTSNTSVLTCLANDESYAEVFSKQLNVLGSKGDLLICLSGSGNSPNIIKAIETSKKLKMKSFAILGFSGGKCLDIVDTAIHFALDDMQIAEDLQMVVGHMLMQWLSTKSIK